MAKSHRELTNLSIAITGGAHGIGRAIARQFAEAGAQVAIGDIDEAGAAETAREHGGIGQRLDVSDRDGFVAFLDAAEKENGPLDVLVNNAGIDWIGPFHEEPDEVTRREVDVNLIGTIIGTRLALQRMLPRDRGHVVNVASGSAACRCREARRTPRPSTRSWGSPSRCGSSTARAACASPSIQPAQVETAMLEGQARPRLMAQITADDVAAAVLRAVREDRFEVWVPASQAPTAKLAAVLPRRAREAVLLGMGIARLTEGTDQNARRAYHERMFKR